MAPSLLVCVPSVLCCHIWSFTLSLLSELSPCGHGALDIGVNGAQRRANLPSSLLCVTVRSVCAGAIVH